MDTQVCVNAPPGGQSRRCSAKVLQSGVSKCIDRWFVSECIPDSCQDKRGKKWRKKCFKKAANGKCNYTGKKAKKIKKAKKLRKKCKRSCGMCD